MQYAAVFITTPNKKEARRITKFLLDKRIIACGNIVGGIESYFWWKDKKEKASESLVMVKTRKSRLKELFAAVSKIHPYEVPEMIALPIAEGYKPYLEWIKKETA